MSKEKETLERTCVNCKHEDKAETEFPCSCCIHNAIDKFEPKPKETNGWIPCSERLPEVPEWMYDEYIVQDIRVPKPYVARWDGVQWTAELGIILKDIIAWHPLPEPYKEGLNRE